MKMKLLATALVIAMGFVSTASATPANQKGPGATYDEKGKPIKGSCGYGYVYVGKMGKPESGCVREADEAAQTQKYKAANQKKNK